MRQEEPGSGAFRLVYTVSGRRRPSRGEAGVIFVKHHCWREILKMNWYQVKVYPAGRGRDVYRVMAINGSESLRMVCGKILSAFDFDFDHLFLFSPGGRNPYHNSIDGDEPGDFDMLLRAFGPKFILLYDFGDDWVFHITVQKVLPDEPAWTIMKSKGEISQYSDYWD